MSATGLAKSSRSSATSAVVLALALLLAACGGIDLGIGSEEPDEPAVEDVEPAPEPDESPDPAAAEEPDGFTGDEDMCAALYPELAAAQSAYLDVAGDMMASGEFDYAQAAAGLRAAAEVAPPEIRDDFLTMAEVLGPFYEVLGTIDMQPGEQPDPAELQRLMAAMQELDQDALERASSNIEAYFNEHC